MAWLKIDDRVRTHPKVISAGPLAAWLWLCGLCYCREHLTDGFLRKDVIPTLSAVPNVWKHAAKLVEVGLWEDAVGGFNVHDFLKWNPSKEAVVSLRDKERDKKRTQRGTWEGQDRDSRMSARDHARDARGAGSGSVLGSEALDLPEESARETSPARFTPPANPHRRPGNLIDGAALRTHGTHAWCSLPREGLCVPVFLHQEFMGRGQKSDDEMRRWYGETLAAFDGIVVGDKPIEFWRNQFAAWIGTVTAPPANSRERRTLAAAARTQDAIARGDL